MPTFSAILGNRILVLDGAMGTMLHREGAGHGCPELLNAEAPDVVARVSELYRQSGSDCSITNTFGGSRPRLDGYGLGERVEEFNVAGVELARRAGARYVLADVGPIGLVMEPLGQVTFDEAFAAWFAGLAEALQDEILAHVVLLRERGPLLGRPYVDTLEDSRFTNMKELRVQFQGDPWRILFAFDPRRTAILLVEGNKRGTKQWYKKHIPIADERFKQHLRRLEEEH